MRVTAMIHHRSRPRLEMRAVNISSSCITIICCTTMCPTLSCVAHRPHPPCPDQTRPPSLATTCRAGASMTSNWARRHCRAAGAACPTPRSRHRRTRPTRPRASGGRWQLAAALGTAAAVVVVVVLVVGSLLLWRPHRSQQEEEMWEQEQQWWWWIRRQRPRCPLAHSIRPCWTRLQLLWVQQVCSSSSGAVGGSRQPRRWWPSLMASQVVRITLVRERHRPRPHRRHRHRLVC